MAFKMKVSPHKRGTIEGTSAHKANTEIIEAAAGAYAKPIVDVEPTADYISEGGKIDDELLPDTEDSIDSQLEELEKKYKNKEISEEDYKKKKKALEDKKI